MDRRSFCITGLAMAVGAALPGEARTEVADPGEVVRAIYRRVAAKRSEGGSFLIGTARARRAAFSRRTATLWEAVERKTKDEGGAVDFDVVTNSQDPAVTSARVVAEETGAERALVAATLVESRKRSVPADAVIRYVLVREGGSWLIDDIRGSVEGKPWSLLEILRLAGG